MTPQGKIAIGTIVNTHGIKGELKINPDTDFQSFRYAKHKTLYVSLGETLLPLKIKAHRSHKGYDLLTFEGLEDINLVERFKGMALLCDDEPVENLAKNEFHVAELSGRSVVQEGIQKGEVAGVRSYPQGDYLEVRLLDGTLRIVPFRDEFVKPFDRKEGPIEIVMMEGLLE